MDKPTRKAHEGKDKNGHVKCTSETEVRYMNDRYTNSSTSDVELTELANRRLVQKPINTRIYHLPPPPQQQLQHTVKTVIEFPKKVNKPAGGMDMVANLSRKSNSNLYQVLANELKNFRSSNWITIYKVDEDESAEERETAEKTKAKDKKAKDKEVSIISLESKPDVLNWGFISQPPKPQLLKLMREIIDFNINPNVVVRIGEQKFDCHLILLRAYSQYFRDIKFHRIVDLPPEQITPCGFQMLYTWLLAEHPLLQREGIVELFQAAAFLGIEELQTQCWQCFDDDTLANEHLAYFLYMEARKYKLSTLSELMLRRITKFFLPLVASQDFLNMNVVDVCSLLSSNCIGVNSEAEVFMTIVYWLDYDWEDREKYVIELCKCVRFALMPPYYLISFSKLSLHQSDQLQRVVGYPEVARMISDALSVSIWQLYDRNQLDAPEKPYITPRLWIYDKTCQYHDKLLCANMIAITFQTFTQYLDHLQEMPPSHYESFEIIPPQRVIDADPSASRYRYDGNDCSDY